MFQVWLYPIILWTQICSLDYLPGSSISYFVVEIRCLSSDSNGDPCGFVFLRGCHEWLGWFTWSTKHLCCTLRSTAKLLHKPESRRWSALLETLLIFPESVQSKDGVFPNYWAVKCSPIKLSWLMKQNLCLSGCLLLLFTATRWAD